MSCCSDERLPFAGIRDFVARELEERLTGRSGGPRVVSAYDSRSTLLHDGHLDGALLAKAIEDFKTSMNAILLRASVLPLPNKRMKLPGRGGRGGGGTTLYFCCGRPGLQLMR